MTAAAKAPYHDRAGRATASKEEGNPKPLEGIMARPQPQRKPPAVDNTLAMVVANSGGVWDAAHRAKKELRSRAKLVAQKFASDSDALKLFHDSGIVAERRHEVENMLRLPDLPDGASNAHLNLNLGHANIQRTMQHYVAGFDARVPASKIANLKSKGGSGHARAPGRAHQVALELFENTMAKVSGKDVPVVTSKLADAVKPELRLCFLAQRCLCGNVGRGVEQIKNAIDNALKREFPTQESRQTLKHGYVAMISFGSDPHRIRTARSEIDVHHVLAFHAADAVLQPFHPYWHAVELVDNVEVWSRDREDEHRLADLVETVLTFKSIHASPSPYDVAVDCAQDFLWEVAFLRIRMTRALVPEFKPNGFRATFVSRRLHVVYDPLGLGPAALTEDAEEPVDAMVAWGDLAMPPEFGGGGGGASSSEYSVEPPPHSPGVGPGLPPEPLEDPWIDILLPSDSDGEGGRVKSPALAHGPHPKARKGAAGDWLRINVLGGFLMFSERFKCLDAPCTTHTAKCKVDRSLGVSAPIGRHMAFLALGADPDNVADEAEHRALKADIATAEYYECRVDGRKVFMDGVPAETAQKVVDLETHRGGEGKGEEPRIAK